MGKLFLLILLALIAGVFLTTQQAWDPGYVFIAYGRYTFETSVFALLVALLLIFVVLKLILSLLGWLNPLRWGSSKRAKG